MGSVTYILKLRDQLSRVAQRAQASLNKTTVAAQRTADAVDTIGLAAGGLAIAGLFKMGAELEQTQLLFNTLTGSVEKGTKLFENLTQFANSTPFSNQALNKNAKTLLAFGADAEDVEQNLRMLGDVAAGDSERLGRLTLAFAQSRSAARLMGQDLLQFINAGFNPLQIISEKTGKSMLYLKKQMEKGLIPFSMVKKAFQIATAEGGKFHGLTEKMATTMAGKWSTVMGKAKFQIAELGLSMKSLFLPFLDGAIKAIDFTSKHRAVMFPLIKALVIFMGTLISIVAVIKVWIGVQKVLNALLFANPVGATIAAIAVLAAIVGVAWKESEKFRRVMYGWWEVIKLTANAIWISVKRAFEPLIESLRILRIRVTEAWGSMLEFIDSFSNGDGKIAAFADSINIDLIESFRNLNKAIGLNIVAMSALFSGDKDKFKVYRNMAKDFLRGNQIVPEGYQTAGQKAAAAFQRGYAKGGKAVKPIFKAGADAFNSLDFGLTEDMKKLQAEGVVSGGIKTFNINIGNLTGISTLSTTNMKEGAEASGRSVINELLKALADIKDI